MRIIPLSDDDDFGIYCSGRRDPETGLNLLYRGTLKACVKWRRNHAHLP